MPDREKVIKGIDSCLRFNCGKDCPYYELECMEQLGEDVLALLKEQENLKQKMWNALYAEEDDLEEKFIGTEKHNDWFFVYRPWLQRGFEIAIKVIADQEGA